MKVENTQLLSDAGQSAYLWGQRLQYAHVAAFAVALINGLANYYQADALDKFLKGMNVNASPEEVYYLYDITTTVSGVMAILLIGIHFMAWWYVRQLIQTGLTPSPSRNQVLFFFVQPAAGLIWWFRSREAKVAYEEERRIGSHGFLSYFWAILVIGLLLFYGTFGWLLIIPIQSLMSEVLIQLSYAHFSLAVANFVFLLSHVLGWRAVYRVQLYLD